MKFEQPMEAPPPAVDDDIRRREEEELQRVLELSMQDKGGRQWGGYVPSTGGTSSRDNLPSQTATSSSKSSKPTPQQPTGGYAASSSRRAVDVVHDAPLSASSSTETAATVPTTQPAYTAPKPAAAAPAAAVPPAPVPKDPVYQTISPVSPVASFAAAAPAPAPVPDLAIATRVRALHNFEPADAGELAFEKGDVIKVVDRTHKDWWKGQLKGRTGIFPVNYVVCCLFLL
jgi:signal transducing adaptor molecule